ncbi:hypothetical protein DYB32_008573 [Aphanomyces invadans]|uniref:EF-hand domain-containing protein n=1 Tax=Aphanomyces invadans TaxID=157072 RepID=A0A418AKN5_9STRA|nr:hypothetical protein DYB32_008573 [Aphanomyces invadans]
MIVGLIYLLVKFCMYAGIVAKGGLAYQAMDAADLLILFTVMSMVVQSVCIFLRLKRTQRELDEVAILSASDVLRDATASQEASTSQSRFLPCLSSAQEWSRQEFRCQIKLLGQFFLHVYKLPQLFSFAKYIQDVQETQVSHLIEIDITIWVFLMGLYAAFFALTGELFDGAEYKVRRRFQLLQCRLSMLSFLQAKEAKRLTIFALFAYLLLLAMVLLLVYLKHLVQVLLQHAAVAAMPTDTATSPSHGHTNLRQPKHLFAALQNVVCLEDQAQFEPADDAIERMRKIAEELLDTSAVDPHGGDHGPSSMWLCFRHDMLCQLLGSGLRKLQGHSHKKPHLDVASPMHAVHLPYFSRKFTHFLIQLLLIVNGFYYALWVNCIMYIDGFRVVAALKMVGMVLPLVVNTFVLAPQLVKQFSVVNGTWRVNAKHLSDLVESFAEVESMKKQMVMQILTHLHHHSKSLGDLETALKIAANASAATDRGYVDMEVVRRVLKQFGFKFARRKFHSFVRLEFHTRGTAIRYADVMRLLRATEAAESSRCYHYLV